MFSLPEIEGEVRWVFDHLGIDDEAPPPILEVAKKLTGTPVLTVPFRVLHGDGQLAKVNGEARIYVRSGLTPKRLRWAVAHELGHHILKLDSSTLENEDAVNAFAAALLVPRRAFQLALRETGPKLSYTKLARWFATTESCAALRFGEVVDVPLALFAPTRTRMRGPEFGWDSSMHGPGIKRARLSDDSRRVAFCAAI